MMSTVLNKNSKTKAALTFCLVTAAIHTFPWRIWKKLVLAILVTGDLIWPLAWITLTLNASTALRLKWNVDGNLETLRDCLLIIVRRGWCLEGRSTFFKTD